VDPTSKFSAKHGRWSCEAISAHKAWNYNRMEALTINVGHTLQAKKILQKERMDDEKREEKQKNGSPKMERN